MHKQLVTRPTAIALAFKEALEAKGYNTTGARMPLKREPVWSVTRRRRSK